MTRRQHLGIAIAAGLVSGCLVLGIGGRIAMRIVGYTTSEPERFTLAGTLQVIGIGTGWGAITAPILLLLQGSPIKDSRWLGPGFGGIVLSPAILALLVMLGFGGRIVAPGAFIVASAVLFSVVFLAHGVTAMCLARRWERRARKPSSTLVQGSSTRR